MFYGKRWRKTLTLTLCLFLLGTVGCGSSGPLTDGEPTSVSWRIENCRSGDAKFFGTDIVTSIDGQMVFLDAEGREIKRFEDLPSNWLYALPEEKAVAFSSVPEGLGVAIFDDEKNLVQRSMILEQVMLIDPSFVKAGSVYYVTGTSILGTVNSADYNRPAGEYTIHLYQSKDLKNWSYVGAVAKARKDLEDVRVLYDSGKLIYVYEKESVERGLSQVEMVYSEDGGQTFTEPLILLTADSDHEIAGFQKTEEGYRLYYSCDLLQPGDSYQGSLPYYADFDKDFRLVRKNVRIPTETETGLLLYDVLQKDGKEYYLCARNYLTDNDLLTETR